MLTDEQEKIIADIQASNPTLRVAWVKHSGAGLFVFRQPAPQEYMMFKKQILDPGQQAIAYDNLMRQTVLYPDKAAFIQALTSWPGLSSSKKVIDVLNLLSGSTDEDEAKS